MQVPDGVMAAYESQSEEEEMDEICGTLVQSRHCLQAIQAETRLNIQQHRAVSLCGTAHNTVNIYNSFHIMKQITSWDNQDLDPPFFSSIAHPGGLYRIPDPNFPIPDLGSKRSRIRIRIKEFKHFLLKKTLGKMIWNVHPGSGFFLPIPDPGYWGQKAPDPGSGSRKTSFFRMKHLTCVTVLLHVIVFFSQDELISGCSAEMKSLSSLLTRLETSDSFLAKKKRREARSKHN